jgi:MFS family permease
MGDDAHVHLPGFIARRLGPLEDPAFSRLWIGQTTSAFGDSLIPIGMAFAVLRLGGSATGIGLVLAGFTLPRVALILVGGVWADRLPRQRVMLAADIVRGLVQVGLAFLLLSNQAQLIHLVVGAVILGAASAFFVPASSGLIPQTVREDRLQQANALMSLSRNATSIIGPSISGLLVVTVGSAWVFAVDAVTYAVSTVSLVGLRVARPLQVEARQGFLAELRSGWQEVVSRRWLLAAIITFGFSNVASGPVFVLGPVVAQQHLRGAADWGLIVTSMGVGGLLGGLVALRWRPRRPLATGFGLGLAFSFPLLALAAPLPVPAIMLAALLALAVGELTNTWWYTVLQEQVPPQALSRVSSYDWLASIVFQPIGFALAGPIAAATSFPITLIGAAALSLAANMSVLAVPAIRHLGWKETSAKPEAVPGQTPEGPIAGQLELEPNLPPRSDQLPQ